MPVTNPHSMTVLKVIGNIIVALLSPVFFLIKWLPNIFNAVFYQRYVYYDFRITSLSEYLLAIYRDSYLPISLLSLIFIFIPFQIVKDFYQRKGQKLIFLKKVGLLSFLTVVLILGLGVFTNIWVSPWYNNLLYLLFALFFGALFTVILHLLVDRFEDRKTLKL